MIRDEHIETAVTQGVLTAEQAEALRAIARGVGASAAESVGEVRHNPDDERFRLIGGFNDVFVTIGIGLLVAGLYGLSSVLNFELGFPAFGIPAAWGLSEIFARRMRLALPSIALAVMLALGAGLGGGWLGAMIAPDFALLGAALAVVAGAALHERRFGVPVNWAIGAVGLTYVIAYGITLAAPEWADRNWYLMFAVIGLLIFAVALRIDATDVERRTRRSDIAFWLHLVAAPMIVHGTIPLLVGSLDGMTVAQALGVLTIFAVLGLIAIVIDRRALLVSGLAYAGFAIGYLLTKRVETGLGSALTLILLAALVLGLSAGWRGLRRALIPLLPLGALKPSIPPTS